METTWVMFIKRIDAPDHAAPPNYKIENKIKLKTFEQGKCQFSGVRCRLAENILEKCNLPRSCKFSDGGCLHEDELDKLEVHEGTASKLPVS